MKILCLFAAFSLFASTRPAESVGHFKTRYTYALHTTNEETPIPCDLAEFSVDNKRIDDQESRYSCKHRPALNEMARNCISNQFVEADRALLSSDKTMQ